MDRDSHVKASKASFLRMRSLQAATAATDRVLNLDYTSTICILTSGHRHDIAHCQALNDSETKAASETLAMQYPGYGQGHL